MPPRALTASPTPAQKEEQKGKERVREAGSRGKRRRKTSPLSSLIPRLTPYPQGQPHIPPHRAAPPAFSP